MKKLPAAKVLIVFKTASRVQMIISKTCITKPYNQVNCQFFLILNIYFYKYTRMYIPFALYANKNDRLLRYSV